MIQELPINPIENPSSAIFYKYKSILFVLFLTVILLSVSIIYFIKSNKYITINNISNNTQNDIFVSATWYWKSPDEMTHDEIQKVINFAKKENFTVIYLDISKITEIMEEDQKVAESKKQKLMNSIATFISTAKNSNIAIQALGGHTNWANSSHWYIPLGLLNFVEQYNKSNPNLTFSGIHYDIEFYNDEYYKKSSIKNEWRIEFLELTNLIVNKTRTSEVFGDNFEVGFAIPFWYDSNPEYTQKMSWKGNTDSFFNLFVDILNKHKNSYIAIMAYRTFHHGDNGTISLSSGEFSYIEENAPNVSIIIALDTSKPKEEEEYVTFYGKTKENLLNTLITTKDKFSKYRSFKGVAIHSLSSYKELVSNTIVN